VALDVQAAQQVGVPSMHGGGWACCVHELLVRRLQAMKYSATYAEAGDAHHALRRLSHWLGAKSGLKARHWLSICC
jgi:hypothetical protein